MKPPPRETTGGGASLSGSTTPALAACARNDKLRPASADRINPAYSSAATASVAVFNAGLLPAASLILDAMPLHQITAAVARQCTRSRSTVASSSGNNRQLG